MDRVSGERGFGSCVGCSIVVSGRSLDRAGVSYVVLSLIFYFASDTGAMRIGEERARGETPRHDG